MRIKDDYYHDGALKISLELTELTEEEPKQDENK